MNITSYPWLHDKYTRLTWKWMATKRWFNESSLLVQSFIMTMMFLFLFPLALALLGCVLYLLLCIHPYLPMFLVMVGVSWFCIYNYLSINQKHPPR